MKREPQWPFLSRLEASSHAEHIGLAGGMWAASEHGPHPACEGELDEPSRAYLNNSTCAAPARARVLASKLRLTSLVLGCSTNKELCARFAAVNPATAFVPQNAYKWLSGKAVPRVSSVYEDWAQVLGGHLPTSGRRMNDLYLINSWSGPILPFRPHGHVDMSAS